MIANDLINKSQNKSAQTNTIFIMKKRNNK